MPLYEFDDCRARPGSSTDQEQLRRFMASPDVIFEAGVQAGVVLSSDRNNYMFGRLSRIQTRTDAARVFRHIDWKNIETMGVTKVEARPFIVRQLKALIEGPRTATTDEE